jgi:putative hydrolase of the HAD superfamily
MIMFDYGHTLIAEEVFSAYRGTEALMPYITSNPDNLTIQQINQHFSVLYDEFCSSLKFEQLEFSGISLQNLVYDYLRLTFSVDEYEIERIFWDASSAGSIMPHVDDMLRRVRELGIRTAVISNASISGRNMRARIERLLPKHQFEFIMSTCDYVIRKPRTLLFETALRKAGLPASDVWFCGDNIVADVAGSASAGIFPIWYDERTIVNEFHAPAGAEPTVPHLRITDWNGMIHLLSTLR